MLSQVVQVFGQHQTPDPHMVLCPVMAEEHAS